MQKSKQAFSSGYDQKPKAKKGQKRPQKAKFVRPKEAEGIKNMTHKIRLYFIKGDRRSILKERPKFM